MKTVFIAIILSLAAVFLPAACDKPLCSRSKPCEDGSCCSKYGYCGYGDLYCGAGCQANCNAEAKENADVECSKTKLCEDGSCCSKWGFCGLGKEFCGRGCQSNCDQTEKTTTKTKPKKVPTEDSEDETTMKPTAAKKKSADTECSKEKPCEDGSCCSKWGFCGLSTEHCGKGCLSNCNGAAKNKPAPKKNDDDDDASTDADKECSRTKLCADGACCSEWGFCGSSPAHCGKGCLSNCPKNAKNYDEPNCSKTKPCEDGSCCSKWGFCGTGPNFCGKGCLSNCDEPEDDDTDILEEVKPKSSRTTECGRFAAAGQEFCPLNICCSQFGYCGTTPEFCRGGCQSNCERPSRPVCANSVTATIKRVIGYYAGWSLDPESRKCGLIPPEKINPEAYTHLIFSFATVVDNKLALSEKDRALAKRLVALKRNNPELRVMLAVGGWAFNDKPTEKVFTKMASNSANRRLFAQSTVSLLDNLGFDGLDVDWEYPVARERGGEVQDYDNYVLLLKELRRQFQHRLLLSVAAPASYWYLRHFDILRISELVDWINVMTYDMHGVWDAPRQPVVNCHTNLTEIDNALEIYYRAGVRPEQLNMGLAFYARTFQLTNPRCSLPGCPFSEAGKAGPCTNSPGTLSYYEISKILKEDIELDPRLDKPSASKILLFEDDQWIGYDDPETLRLKLDYAKQNCLGGVMVWSVDQDTELMTLERVLLQNARKPLNQPAAQQSMAGRRFNGAIPRQRQI